MNASREDTLTKAEFNALNALMEQDIQTAMLGRPKPAKLPKRVAERLLEKGMIEPETFELTRDRFGAVVVPGYSFTIRGHALYCKLCAEMPDEEGEEV